MFPIELEQFRKLLAPEAKCFAVIDIPQHNVPDYTVLAAACSSDLLESSHSRQTIITVTNPQ